MKRHLRLFALYFAQYAKVRLAYKADFFIAFFSSMTATVIGFGFVLVLFTKIPTLQGWSFYEILFLYAFSLVPLGFFTGRATVSSPICHSSPIKPRQGGTLLC
ncbi:MAG: hypothetical protein DMG22_18190 [Acidobacteria bacterium]|nr:MAG: hypothetical protein DMG22_18190 [Acidobacteriota bacterium]